MKLHCKNCGKIKSTQEKWWKFSGEPGCGHHWSIISGGTEKDGWLIPYKLKLKQNLAPPAALDGGLYYERTEKWLKQ